MNYRTHARTASPPARRRRILARRLWLLIPLLALGLLLSCGQGGGQSELWIIGLDGADWDILEPYIARGDMPNLDRLRREGAWGVLRSDEPMLSPILWTSIATGKSADLHGITWFMSATAEGEMIPVSSHSRQVRALWNIASEQDVKVGFIGWWATWPAEPVNGFMVSDYLAYHSFGVSGEEVEVPGKTWPAEITNLARSLFPNPAEISNELIGQMIHLPPERLGYAAAESPYSTPVQHLRQAIATSRGYTELAKELLKREKPRLFSIYYEGTDAAEHLFTSYAPPRLPWVSEEDHAIYRDALPEYWKWQDELLGDLLEQRGSRTTIMIVSDHGFRTGEERLMEETASIETADQSHMIDGVVLLHGPPVRAGARIRGADIYDVTPTALYLLDLPVAEDMTGQVIQDAFTAAHLSEHPVRTLPTFETGPWDRGGEIVVDPMVGENVQQMLSALGYIGGGEDRPTEAGEQEQSNVEQAVNLAVVLRKQQRREEAVEILEGILADNPEHPEARFNLGITYGQLGKLDEAADLFRGLVKDEPNEMRNHDNLARTLWRQNKLDEALSVFNGALEQDPEWARGLTGKGSTLHQLGRNEEALRALNESLRLNPRLADTHYYRGLVLLAKGREAEGRQSLERALELDPTHATAENYLVTLMMNSGEYTAAQARLEAALDRGDESPKVLERLGTIYVESGQPQQALPLLEKALPAFKDNPDFLGNLGMAHAMNGDIPRGTYYFEKILEIDPDHTEAKAQLGAFYAQQNRFDDAERLLKEAVASEPANGDLHVALGSLYHFTSRYPEAEEQYKEAIRLVHGNAAYHMRLSMLYHQMEREDLSRHHYERAVAIDPNIASPTGGQQGGQGQRR